MWDDTSARFIKVYNFYTVSTLNQFRFAVSFLCTFAQELMSEDVGSVLLSIETNGNYLCVHQEENSLIMEHTYFRILGSS